MSQLRRRRRQRVAAGAAVPAGTAEAKESPPDRQADRRPADEAIGDAVIPAGSASPEDSAPRGQSDSRPTPPTSDDPPTRPGTTSELDAAMDGPVRLAGGQLLGTREAQEDDFGFVAGATLDPEGHHPAIVVADGMGGHAAGDVASGLVVREFMDAYGVEGRPADRLHAALDRANRALGAAIAAEPALQGMGTTLVAAAVTADGLEWISVGDSALLLYRDGQLKRLNQDHSMRPVIAALQEIDPAAADDMSPHQLRSALVGSDIALIDASSMPELLMPGDFVVAATDGMDTLDDQEIAADIADHCADGPEAIRDALLAAVADRGAPIQDNATVAIIEAPPQEQG